MVALLISIPILGVLAIIQSAIISSSPLLLGTTDLVLIVIIAWALQDKVNNAWQWSLIGSLIMTILSGMPFGVYFIAYPVIILIAGLIKRRIWKVPFLGMLITIFFGTFFLQILSWFSRWLLGVYIPIDQALVLIILPSTLLNLLIGIPVYIVMKDIAKRLYPEEINV